MFKNTYQHGLLSIFYSCGTDPLAIWDMEVKNGHVKRLTDSEVNSLVLEIVSSNVATTFIKCPKRKQVLGIKLPYLVMIVKNLKRNFSFEITVLDDRNMRRRFRISNFQNTTKIMPFCTSMPIGLSGGWNQIQFNLADFTKRAYGSQFQEALSVQIHANARLRRIYFAERLYTEEELPQEYKLYMPLERNKKKVKAEKIDKPPKAVARKPQSKELPKEEVISKKSSLNVISPLEPEEVKVEPEEIATPVEEAEGKAPVEEATEQEPDMQTIDIQAEEPPPKVSSEGEEVALAGEEIVAASENPAGVEPSDE